MSILVCTPAYGAKVTTPYFRSCLNLQATFLENGIKYDWLITDNESLITRARNTSVAAFMKLDYEALLFLDSDIEFEPDDVAKLWNLVYGGAEVAVGAYPMKNFADPIGAWVDGKLVPLSSISGIQEVDYAGTGFMMIKRSCIERLMKEYPELEHEEGKVGRCWALFDTMIRDDCFLSEDYAFCRRLRDKGGKVILDPSIKLRHWGNFCYGGKSDPR